MKKLLCLCLCLALFLLVACSSEKEAKPPAAATPPKHGLEEPVLPEPISSLSGEYVFAETISKKTKVGDQEYTCQTTHTYTLRFSDGQTVRYTAKTDQSIDPPTEGMMCQSKLYNVDTSGTYEIKHNVVTLTFSPSEGKMPWVDKNVFLLRLKDANTLEIVYNGSKFQKQ